VPNFVVDLLRLGECARYDISESELMDDDGDDDDGDDDWLHAGDVVTGVSMRLLKISMVGASVDVKSDISRGISMLSRTVSLKLASTG